MKLLKYFNRIELSKEERNQSVLPKPDGPLVRLIPCSTTESANSTIREFLPMQCTVDEARPRFTMTISRKNVASISCILACFLLGGFVCCWGAQGTYSVRIILKMQLYNVHNTDIYKVTSLYNYSSLLTNCMMDTVNSTFSS